MGLLIQIFRAGLKDCYGVFFAVVFLIDWTDLFTQSGICLFRMAEPYLYDLTIIMDIQQIIFLLRT